jgi:hypothetical protein
VIRTLDLQVIDRSPCSLQILRRYTACLLEPNPEERLFQPRKIARTKTWRVDIDAGLYSGIQLAGTAGSDEAGRMPDRGNSCHVEFAGECFLGVRPVQFGDQADNKLQILGVIRNNFRWAVKLALGRLGNFAIRQRDSSHVGVIDTEHSVPMTRQIFSE